MNIPDQPPFHPLWTATIILTVLWLLGTTTSPITQNLPTERAFQGWPAGVDKSLPGEEPSSELAPVNPAGHAPDQYWRTYYAQQLVDARRLSEDSPPTPPPAAPTVENQTGGAHSATPPPPVWTPVDECDRINVPGPGPTLLTNLTMSWCPMFAAHLNAGEQQGLWTWEPGDLTKLMYITQHESAGGDPQANERNWGDGPGAPSGLCSHRRRYWEERTLRYLGHVGTLYQPDQHDDIHLCTHLFKREGAWHWNGAARSKLAPTLAKLGLRL